MLSAGDLTNPNENKYTLEYYMKMAEEIVEQGCHAIGIKDMAGLLKPRAATELISALRAAHPNVVLHVHTHDSAGTAVATQLAAAAAGADIVDLAMDAMSGCTSQVRAAPCRAHGSMHLQSWAGQGSPDRSHNMWHFGDDTSQYIQNYRVPLMCRAMTSRHIAQTLIGRRRSPCLHACRAFRVV